MIDVENVDIILSKKLIVDHVCVQVQKGEFVGVIGPNGSGKSTLLKTIYRTLKASDGLIKINDRDIRDMSLRESALQSSVVSQHNHYSFDFKVKDVVIMGRAPHKKSMEFDNEEDHRIADEAISQVDMTDFVDRSFSTLSGGEQQRIILARSLAQQTPCLLLDEPTNHLDIKYQLQLLDVVKSIDVTVLCALHDLNLAAAYCDRIYLLKDGKIFAYGTPDDVLTEEIIEEVYDVKVTVERSRKTGLLNIIYHPGFIKVDD
jgi:ABC-type cobalamin/Fe3+-siderophores transport systems, ATPase components